jgi:hypothetical protein
MYDKSRIRTPQLIQNLFDTPYAHALLAFSGTPDSPGPAIALALYFFNYSTWTGRPGLYVLIHAFIKCWLTVLLARGPIRSRIGARLGSR